MYRWAKVWAVQTDIDDEVDVGDVILVDAQNGDSKQTVLSVTVMTTKSGKEYKTLLTQEAK